MINFPEIPYITAFDQEIKDHQKNNGWSKLAINGKHKYQSQA